MNPLVGNIDGEGALPEPPTPAPLEIDEVGPLQFVDETPVAADITADDAPFYAANANVIDDVTEHNDPVEETAPAFTAAAAVPDENFANDLPSFDDKPSQTYQAPVYTRDDEGGYSITVIQDNPGSRRNLLLLGSTFLVMTVALSATVISLFQKDLGIGAIGDERSLAYLIDEVPMTVEEEPKPEKNKGGGGGGGGKDEKDPVNQGDLPDQSKNPIRPPDVRTPRADFELKTPTPTTEGSLKTPKVFNQWGDPNSRFGGLSNGSGSGGGIGTGNGTGVGSGNGTGMGSGSGSGSGSGVGAGNGPGSGPGGDGTPPPPKPVGVTSPFKILSKPQAKYNDAGRTNGVQGSVRLKITLLANGSVGSITPVTRLPHGLTEQAIAAARQLRFEPKKINGQPVSTIVTIDYSFSIY
ncbi:MAG: energy transducer TonB [Pyrinomonadaceae bacterium]